MISGLEHLGIDPSALDIMELIPQQPPFVMIDRMIDIDDTDTVTAFTPLADNLFVGEDGLFSIYGLAENVAQTCAVRLGFINKMSGRPIEVGYIGGIRHMRLYRCPAVGESVTTVVSVRESVFGLTMVHGVVRASVAGDVLMECEMKIAVNANSAKL